MIQELIKVKNDESNILDVFSELFMLLEIRHPVHLSPLARHKNATGCYREGTRQWNGPWKTENEAGKDVEELREKWKAQASSRDDVQ